MNPMTQISLFETQETHPTWPDILIPDAMEALSQDQGQVIVFTGHRNLLLLGHYLMTWQLRYEKSVLFVDGANLFDLALITQLSQKLNQDPQDLLRRIHLSRIFTIHQMETVIRHRLETGLQTYHSRLCLISGLLDTFYDEAVPLWERLRILKKIMVKLCILAGRGYQIVALAADPPSPTTKKTNLTSIPQKYANRIFSLTETNGTSTLKETTPATRRKSWTFLSWSLLIKRPSR